MKAAIILLLVFLGATAWGAQSVFLGLRDRDLATMSCRDYLAHPPAGRWIKLVDCEADFTRMLERTENGKVDAVWVALRPRGVTGGVARIVAETEDGPLPRGTTSIQGMVRTGFLDDAADSFRDRLAAEVNAVPNATIVDVGAEPHLLLGLLALIGGLGGLSGAVYLGIRVRRARR